MDSIPPLNQVMRLGKLCTQLDEVMIIEAENGSRVGSVGMGKAWENHGENRWSRWKTMGKPWEKHRNMLIEQSVKW